MVLENEEANEMQIEEYDFVFRTNVWNVDD